MVSKKELFQQLTSESHSGVAFKAISLKKKIIAQFAKDGDCTIADLCRDLNASIPTVTKLLGELIAEGFVLDYGKIETSGGRKPNIYGVNPAAVFFMGVEVMPHALNMALLDFRQNLIFSQENVDFELDNTPASFEMLCSRINEFVMASGVAKTQIFGVVINISGRINSSSGYSYSFFSYDDLPLNKKIADKIGIETYIENDTRAMAYGEFFGGIVNQEKNVLFINISRGVGLGIMVDGKLYYGNSGFAGEFGHIPFYNNDTICHCGKRGCLETEASGWALERAMEQLLSEGKSSTLSLQYASGQSIALDDIVRAAQNEDVLSIEQIEKVGAKVGRAIAVLINLFNPELVIVGGTLATVGDYFMFPIKSAVNKYSLTLVSKDTTIVPSVLGSKAGVLGACMLVRARLLERL